MNDRGLERTLGLVLIAGVIASGALMTIGFLGAFAVGCGGSLRGAPTIPVDATSFTDIAAGLRALRPIALAQAGILLLVATPVVRVAVAALGFLAERDWTYVAIATVVLAILLTGLFVVR